MQPYPQVNIWPAYVWRPSSLLTAARFSGKGWLCPTLLGGEDGSVNALSSVMLVELPELERGCVKAGTSCFLSRAAALQGKGPPTQHRDNGDLC